MSPRCDILATRELNYLTKMSWRNFATCLRRRRDTTFSRKNEMSIFRLLQLRPRRALQNNIVVTGPVQHRCNSIRTGLAVYRFLLIFDGPAQRVDSTLSTSMVTVSSVLFDSPSVFLSIWCHFISECIICYFCFLLDRCMCLPPRAPCAVSPCAVHPYPPP